VLISYNRSLAVKSQENNKPPSSREIAIIKEDDHTQSDTGGNSGLHLLKKENAERGIYIQLYQHAIF
jgi:hypothetical protein